MMYRAGSGDAATLPALARLAVDRLQGLLVRASAAEFIAQLVSGTQQSKAARRARRRSAVRAFARTLVRTPGRA